MTHGSEANRALSSVFRNAPRVGDERFCLAFARMLQTFTWKSVVYAGVARVSWMRNSRKVGRAVRYSPHHQLCSPHAKRHKTPQGTSISASIPAHWDLLLPTSGLHRKLESLGFFLRGPGHCGEKPLSGRAFHPSHRGPLLGGLHSAWGDRLIPLTHTKPSSAIGSGNDSAIWALDKTGAVHLVWWERLDWAPRTLGRAN